MSRELAKQLFDGLREAFRDGLQQVAAETGRLGGQGQIELASAIFSGHGFVPYGPGQNPAAPERLQQPQHDQEQQLDHGRDR